MTSAWAFAVAAWERPGVAAICLDLQNLHGQLPALLLWRLWALEVDRPVDTQGLTTAVQTARRWEAEVLVPLRDLRRRLADRQAPEFDDARARVRRRVLEAELEAEHALMDALETLETVPQSPAVGAVGSRLEAMIDLAAAWRSPAPTAALARLIEAL